MGKPTIDNEKKVAAWEIPNVIGIVKKKQLRIFCAKAKCLIINKKSIKENTTDIVTTGLQAKVWTSK